MDKVVDIRNKWDNVFSERKVSYFVKVLGAICIYFATYALLQLLPFIDLFTEQILVLMALALAIAFFFNETLAMILFGVVLLVGMSGGQAAVAVFAAIALMFVCGNSRFICMLAILVPICLMNIENAEAPLLAVYLPYLILFLCIYFNGKIGTNMWKYAFPVYYTLVAYNFGLYGVVIKDFFAIKWPEKSFVNPITLFVNLTGFEDDFATLEISSLLILALINIVICYIAYSVINLKNIKFLNLQVDLRDLIAFLVAIVLVIAGMLTASRLHNPELVIEYKSIIVQGGIAYLVSRPFASYRVSALLQKKKSNYEEQQAKKVVEGQDFSKSLKDEIDAVLEAHLLESRFQAILSADKEPVNSVLIFGKNELDKHFVIENILNNKGINLKYYSGADLLEEYTKGGNIKAFENIEKNKELEVIVLEKIEEIVNSDSVDSEFNKKLIKYLTSTINHCKTIRNVLFVMTTDTPENLPEEMFTGHCIDKILYGSQNDSVLLNNTYRIIRQIGKGGAGVVYKAHHENLDAAIVVKKMLDTFSDKTSYKAEASVLKQLKHTYLPKVYDVFEENKEFYTVMDYIPGESFQEKVEREGALPQEKVLMWSKQLLEAVEYLHGQVRPIIHSDIKPGNIILTPTGNISLIDFNISCIFDKNNTKSIGVSPGYSPIEQYGNVENYYRLLESRGIKIKSNRFEEALSVDTEKTAVLPKAGTSGQMEGLSNGHEESISSVPDKELKIFAKEGLSEKSDIYSIGATMYTLVTGKKPSLDFNDIKPVSEYNIDISKELCDIISKAMCIDPSRRYDNVMEMKRDIEQINL